MRDDPVIWNKCTPDIYRAVYEGFKNKLSVYSIAGDIGSYFMTTWSLGDAPLIKSSALKNDDGSVPYDDPEKWTYYLATAKYLEETP